MIHSDNNKWVKSDAFSSFYLLARSSLCWAVAICTKNSVWLWNLPNRSSLLNCYPCKVLTSGYDNMIDEEFDDSDDIPPLAAC